MFAKMTDIKLGTNSGLSKMDVQKINKFYGCESSESKINEISNRNEGSKSKSCSLWNYIIPMKSRLKKIQKTYLFFNFC
jgi:Ca2+-binding EF-hand superfamily protein